VVADIALADGATPAQIALAWLLPLVPNVLISPI
jgi:aryl-alcohol dehydrogenase-like predicted oxidoreductase